MDKTFEESYKRYTAQRKKDIRKEIRELQKGIKKLIEEERREPTTGKAHTFRAATYNRYNNQIKELKSELKGL